MNLDEEDDNGIKNLVEYGSAITGSAVGAIIGFFSTGPAGAAFGGASGTLLSKELNKIGNDISKRFLSEREKIRIGGTIYFAVKKIQEKLESGMIPRSDFLQKPTQSHAACAEIQFIERPTAEEIIEGVLLAAQREYEEKKIIFLGNLMANISFDEKVTRAQANSLIRKAKDISFRQMCLLSLFAQSEDFELRNRAYINEQVQIDTFTLLQEIYEMHPLGLLTLPGITLRSIADIIPQKMRVEGIGRLLYDMMELKDIERSDLESLVQLLQ